ncbi:helicase with zinc finger domain 2-like [Saccostrea echinata]|uniref:helicase with zinc finger domain 2-like n=1 Tax=Saccostrea echinata TaxID=191078 RepID=UPI002A83FED2|nr:helicase with zinc finger domain 2-like [Saccostrea echinata]
METDENWVKFFQSVLVCIENKDHARALEFIRQLYDSGEVYYGGVENEDIANEIYRHCLHLLDTGQKKLRLLREIQEVINEYSVVEHPIVWHCMAELRTSYNHMLGLNAGNQTATEIIRRELLKFFVCSGWKLLEENLGELVCRMCMNLRRDFQQYPEFLTLLTLWAHALEKVGKVELAIQKAQEANDEKLESRLLCQKARESDSEPDEEWLKDTYAFDFAKSQEQRKSANISLKKKKSRSRPKRRDKTSQDSGRFDPLGEENKAEDVHNAIVEVNSSIKSWKDVTEFDLPIGKPRRRRHRLQKIIPDEGNSQQHQRHPKSQAESRSKFNRPITRKTTTPGGFSEDEFDMLTPEDLEEFGWDFESSDEESSSQEEFRKSSQGEESQHESFFEESRQFYSSQNQNESIDENLLRNGLELSEGCVSKLRHVKNRTFYHEMRSKEECLELCKNFPDTYKHCKLQIFNPHKALCFSLVDELEIEISGRSKCGKAFNQDQVVVEILKNPRKLPISSVQPTKSSENALNKTFGKVIGITKRNETLPKHPVFVCTLDRYQMYHMKPLCKTVPKIHILNSKKERESQVQIYKYDKRGKDLIFDRLKSIDQSKRKGYIFLVCFIAWNDLYPLGAVIRMFDGKCDIKTSLRLLCLRNNISVLYQKNTVNEVEKIIQQMSDQNKNEQRIDFSESLSVFTIDGKGSQDLDDALSIRKISETEFEIGVHIADVGSVVKKDDPIDREAQERSNSCYPGNNSPPYHMLPEPLATDICSLLPQKKRKTLSIFYKMDVYGNVLGKKIERTLIESRRRFTYQEVQQLLSRTTENEEFMQEFRNLHCITKQIRLRRLKNKIFSFPFESPFKDSDNSYLESLDAHIIVEECMILANQTIGQALIERFPDCVPLRIQSEPSSSKINEWLESYPVIAEFVLSLQDQKLPTNRTLSFENISEDKLLQQLPVQKHIWNKIESNCREKNFKNMQRLIGTDEFHPFQAMAYQSWISFQETSCYQCSGSSQEKGHFSLGIAPYVHFTSPIRRYADLIVNRLVHALLDNKGSPYSQREVEMLCKKINGSRSREFERQCRLMHLGKQIKQQPIILNSLVLSASEKSLLVCFPGQRELTKSCGEIQYHLLKLKSKPDVEESKDKKHLLTLSWQQRLYSSLGFSSNASNSKRGPVKINPHQRVLFMSLLKWKRLLESLIRNNMSSLDENIFFEKEVLPSAIECQGTHSDVSSETIDGIIGKQYTDFSLTFSSAQIIPIQMGAEQYGGMLMPVIHLIENTKNVKCCVQHMSDPVQCFSSYATRHAGNRRMTSSEYIQRWLNIFRMESVTNATKSISIVINDLRVNFHGSGEIYDGSFILLRSFCLQRDIDFRWHIEKESEKCVSYQTDFICIRCELIKGIPLQASIASSPNERRIWVGHGETKIFQRGKNSGDVKVHFKLHKDSPKLAPSMEGESSPVCTVEILQMSDSDKNIEDAFKGLENAGQLAKSIALREKFQSLDDAHVRLAKETKPDVMHESLQPNNEKQLEAIKKALSSRFTLIQGPPGTGKTLTGIKLILLFTDINLKYRENGGDHKQVVYCGPSNKSVDLVARWIRTHLRDRSPKMVRMYGSSIESTVYPIPGRDYINQTSCKDNRPDFDLEEVSLHNLIRVKDKEFAEELRQFDKLFRENPDGTCIDPEKVIEYKKLLSKATEEELKHYDVIFCTTAVATNAKFLKATKNKIFQLIIDEAGMCTEPETMAPIIAAKPDQVVLIGDHKQLQPIIICEEAAKLGLSTSLFERYADNAVFLDIQYRMNEKICEFPSKQFYKGKLKTGPSGKYKVKEPLQIWRNPHIPLLFCHIEGEEECLAVSTEEGNQQSRSNKAEVEHVVKVYDFLMSHNGIQTHNIKVMSQYNAQCFAIRQALSEKRFINYKVNTVVSSQGGEWDYVIFSTVRSLPDYRIESYPTLGWCKKNLGFITDKHQINVALTRARKGIIIIGNKKLLQCDLVWGELISHYTALGCVVDAEKQNLKRRK